jgi:hypothetical protein
VAEALLGSDLQVVRRANRVGQREGTISRHAQVRLELFFRELLEAAIGDYLRLPFVEDIAKKALQEAHLNLILFVAAGPWTARPGWVPLNKLTIR